MSSLPAIVQTLVWILVVLILGGAASWLVKRAPFMSDEYKSAAAWFILAAVVIACIILLLHGLGIGLPF